jgi:hypothetical protein
LSQTGRNAGRAFSRSRPGLGEIASHQEKPIKIRIGACKRIAAIQEHHTKLSTVRLSGLINSMPAAHVRFSLVSDQAADVNKCCYVPVGDITAFDQSLA